MWTRAFRNSLICETERSFRRLGGGSGGVVLVLVLGDPDVSDRITEQNNCEAIGSFRCRKRRRVELEHQQEHEHEEESANFQSRVVTPG